jgi:hypothetical protein
MTLSERDGDMWSLCILCDAKIGKGSRHNPRPLAQSGVACDDCNITRVIPERLRIFNLGNIGYEKEWGKSNDTD